MNSKRDSKPGQRAVCSTAQGFPSAGQGVPRPHRGPGRDAAAFAVAHCFGKHFGTLREGVSLSSGLHHFWSFLSFSFSSSSLPASTTSVWLIKHYPCAQVSGGLKSSLSSHSAGLSLLMPPCSLISSLPSHSSVAHEEAAVKFKQKRLGCLLVPAVLELKSLGWAYWVKPTGSA